MSTDFVGTNTDKIDRLVVTTVEMKTTLRLLLGLIVILLPAMVGLGTYLVTSTNNNTSKIEQFEVLFKARDQQAEERDQTVVKRLDGLDGQQRETSTRLAKVEERLIKVEERLINLEGMVRGVIERLDKVK